MTLSPKDFYVYDNFENAGDDSPKKGKAQECRCGEPLKGNEEECPNCGATLLNKGKSNER